MKRLLFLFAALSLLLAACGIGSNISETSNGEVSEETTEPSANEAEVETQEQVEEKETEVAEEQATASGQEEINLNDYRPATDKIRTYVQDEFQITYEVVDQNDQYVQESVKFGDVSSQHVYQWGKEGFSIVYSEENPQNESSIIEDFKPAESPKEAVSIKSQGTGESDKWDMTVLEEELSVPYDTFRDDVIMMKKTVTSETSGQKTSTIRYYARDVGLVKEVIEVDGENGYTITTELEEITETNE
ncbi:hypothetical protein E2R51_07950 [Jeotgalibacillus sp. S-D1]|uniref:hypothetical protein n=1 Tax=Jeotgalibacillus sp. S-D1 TaxID=2552189 RepID=UPI0010597644|nr:hypothetical protein [Jeotgalibacillus sp. S-D1]TDL32609.1 hypothetical protein E2R51_07950 [Jeotgalibacillus sp. S-D1]